MNDLVHHGDTLAFMKTLPDEFADLIIADPPYNLARDKEFENAPTMRITIAGWHGARAGCLSHDAY